MNVASNPNRAGRSSRQEVALELQGSESIEATISPRLDLLAVEPRTETLEMIARSLRRRLDFAKAVQT